MDIAIGGKTVGKMVFELFDDVVPKTAANFRALCVGDQKNAKGTPLRFRGSIMHRVIEGFMCQGGDFTRRNGTGGESIYGKTFRDENFKLKHGSRGLLSMANCGPHTNGSQFFILFEPAPHLDNKHVVFGRLLRGDSVLSAIEAVRTGAADKPVETVSVLDCGVVRVVSSDEERRAAESDAQEKLAQMAAEKEKARKAAEVRAEKDASQLRSEVSDTVREGLSQKRAREPSAAEDANKKPATSWLDADLDDDDDDDEFEAEEDEEEDDYVVSASDEE